MPRQLKLWGEVWIDLAAKIKKERESGMKVFYHFNGKPLPMFK